MDFWGLMNFDLLEDYYLAYITGEVSVKLFLRTVLK